MPSSRPLRADARRNREALLSAARRAFLDGDTDAHVEDIARRAGVAVGTLYRHFATREALIMAWAGLCSACTTRCSRAFSKR
ncbi:hypothetical protein SFUMM280S_07477 [Streptomyces fumanus]